MSLAKAVARLTGAALAVVVAGCAIADAPSVAEFQRVPREIRTGAADMMIEPVEPTVSREEVVAAVQTLVQRESLCFSWPGLWLDASDRRNFYFVRYDLMARDWGQDIADRNRARMQEFVDLGFLIARERPDIAPGVVEYTLTSEGVAYLRGSPYGGERPSFCAPSQRRVVEVTELEWGEFPCGSLRVRFNHVSDDWPTWARTESARTRIAAEWAPVGVTLPGSVSLSRQWYRRDSMPEGMEQNGELRSLCYDSDRQRVMGDDLELRPLQP
ncbi:MAG TPA: hypothetical protein VEA80_12600 [Vitreimonas sp.]|uniref:hypothetical protein n=1 Tax=Vitreimonas sp. TaxID=3069702 RepID=UPI002D646955|nr:hypothetical protein [Vitreimonas sp.]HYD88307.1 hypothetical protein [Vitreimonas sp.]